MMRLTDDERARLDTLSREILDVAYKVHSALGPGLLESAYEAVLYYELTKAGLKVEKQKPLPLVYEEVKLDAGYRLDLLVEGCFIIEVKSVEALNNVHMAQVMTYLRLSGNHIGFLFNFNTDRLKNSMKRIVNEF